MVVGHSLREVYRFWRNLENLPRFLKHLDRVDVLDARRSRWVAQAPGGLKVTWKAEIVNEKENEFIAWQSIEGSDVHNWGMVRFPPVSENETEVRVELEYAPTGGMLGAIFARLLGEEPSRQLQEDLQRLKEVLEEANASERTAGEPIVSRL